MSYSTYTDLISNLLVPKLVDPGSTLIHVGASDPKNTKWLSFEVQIHDLREIF